jgi:putative IMPACT (imprinted ancient) family translation regulator
MAAAPTATVAQGYWTLASPMLDVELVVKKSRFIASAWPVESAADAQALIAARSDPSASHNCWAFRVRDGGTRSSDDGEPGGTAGRPILGAIEADGLDGVAVLVVRFFGGAKLGAGPLARAYAQAARDAVRAAPKAFVRAMTRARVVAPQQDIGLVYGVVQRVGATAVGEPEFGGGDGGDGGDELALEVSVAVDRAQALADAMAEATAGRARTEVLGGDGG